MMGGYKVNNLLTYSERGGRDDYKIKNNNISNASPKLQNSIKIKTNSLRLQFFYITNCLSPHSFSKSLGSTYLAESQDNYNIDYTFEVEP